MESVFLHIIWMRASSVTQSCPTLSDPRNYSPPGSSVHGIFQARILSWLTFPSPGDRPDPEIEPRSLALQADSLSSEASGNMDVQNKLLDSVGEGDGRMFRENSIETCMLSRVKQITSPGWMHETSARAWCNRKTQRELVEREVGGGMGMGNTCKSMADSCQCMTKPTKIL